jgi:hypothetical protein
MPFDLLLPPPQPLPCHLQETNALYAEYTNATTLTTQLLQDAQEAERRHRRQTVNVELWNQRDWFVTKLTQMNAEMRESITSSEDDTNNDYLHVRAGASGV